MAARFILHEGTTKHRTYSWGFWALWILVIILVGFAYSDVGQISIGENTYNLSLIRLNKAIAFMIAILGLQVVVGFTGQVALGQSFFVGIGAYSAAYLVEDHNWPYLLTLAFIVPFCFVLGMLFGLPALRIKGLYLALVTLGLAAVFPSLVQLERLFTITNGAGGKQVSSRLNAPDWVPLNEVSNALQRLPLFGSYFGDGDLSSREADRLWKYFLFAVIAFVCFWLVGNLIKSRPGRALRAIRDNETGAAVSGVNLAMDKTLSFGVASALGGVAGMVYVAELGIASPSDFTQLLAINFIVGLVIGGVGSLAGAVVGGLIIALIPDWAASTSSVGPVPDRWLTGPTGAFILGVMLIILMFVLPGGFVAGARKLKARIVQVVPRAPGPPSGAASASADPDPDDHEPAMAAVAATPIDDGVATDADLRTTHTDTNTNKGET
jgi:branched-chain amino acid transport system permease protein